MAIATDLRDRIDLAGAWQLAFDPAGQGIGDGWASGGGRRTGRRPSRCRLSGSGPTRTPRALASTAGSSPFRRIGRNGCCICASGEPATVRRSGSTVTSSAATRAPTPRSGSTRRRRRGSATRTSSWCGSRGSRARPDVDGQPLLQAPISKQTGTTSKAACGAMSPWKRSLALVSRRGHSTGSAQREAVGVEVVIRNAHPRLAPSTLALAVRSPAGDLVASCESRHDPAGGGEIPLSARPAPSAAVELREPAPLPVRARAREGGEASIAASPPSACATSRCAMASSS